jgi:hypothetical protein
MSAKIDSSIMMRVAGRHLGGTMLDAIIEHTDEYIASKPIIKRKGLGQFFRLKETARFMTSLFNISSQYIICVLDPGADSGMLSVALIAY